MSRESHPSPESLAAQMIDAPLEYFLLDEPHPTTAAFEFVQHHAHLATSAGPEAEATAWLSLQHHLTKVAPQPLQVSGQHEAATSPLLQKPGDTWRFFATSIRQFEQYLDGMAEPDQFSLYLAYNPRIVLGLIETFHVLNESGTSVGFSTAERLDIYQQLHATSAKLSHAFFTYNKPKLAIAFGHTLYGKNENEQFLQNLTQNLQQIADNDWPKFRKLYHYAVSNLRPEQVKVLEARLPSTETPLLPGGIRVTIPGSKNTYLEYYEEGHIIWAKLADGSPIALPHVAYRNRLLTSYGSPREQEHHAKALAINYTYLPDEAKAAVDLALARDREGTPTPPGESMLRRLIVWPAENEGALYSAVAGNERQSIAQQPSPTRISSNTVACVPEKPIAAAEIICDTYMVTSYKRDHTLSHQYNPTDPDMFAPPDTGANAFWIMGTPRNVHKGIEHRLLNGPDPKFVITPIRYYRVTYVD